MHRLIEKAGQQKNNLALLAVAAAIVALCCVAYWPGLNGPFLLDDFGSLGALGKLGGVDSWETMRAYVFGGFTGPSGRPLALITFLIDGTNWPTDPWPFKRTNLVIHLLNGILLAAVCAQIFRIAGFEKSHARWLALLSAACWLLHPFLVSTTLYPVQRMAQLAATFVFGGLAVYIHGRLMLDSRPRAGYLAMSIAVCVFTTLAVLSKENGILLPLLIIVLEFTMFAAPGEKRVTLNRTWASIFLALPTLIVFVFMARYGLSLSFFEPNPPRDFSTYERLLTEARILVDYLWNWFLPSPYTPGIFQDHVQHSTGFLSPVSTALSLVFHAVLITGCIVYRRKYPLLAFSLLFFYAGQLLESTFLNLELYFEHRNYLPAAFLFLPVFAAVSRKFSHTVFALVGLAFVCLLGSFTGNTARIWQDYATIVQASARAAPMSARAQQQYSMVLFNAQRRDVAMRVIDGAIERMPRKQNLLLWNSAMRCESGLLENDEFNATIDILATQPYDLRVLGSYQTLFGLVVDGKCPDVDVGALKHLFERMLEYPANSDPVSAMYSQLQYFLGSADLQLGNIADAMQSFDRALKSRPGAGRAMAMAALLATNGRYAEAARLSATALEFKARERAGELQVSEINEQDILDFQSQLRDESAER